MYKLFVIARKKNIFLFQDNLTNYDSIILIINKNN